MFNRTIALMIAAVAALAPIGAYAQDKINLRFTTAWDPNFIGTIVGYKKFVDSVAAASGGRITFTVTGPEVVAGTQQFEPVSHGVFDAGFSSPAYYVGTTGVPYAFLALKPDAGMWRQKGYWDIVDKELQRFNQKLIAFFPASPQEEAYQILLREPLGDGDQPLKGRKIRGNRSYEPLVAALGGQIVNLPMSEMYSGLEKGVVDGAAFTLVGIEDLKVQEVTKFMVRPQFGSVVYSIAMNLKKFNSLSAADQQLLLDKGREIEAIAPVDYTTAATASMSKLKDAGMKETVLAPVLFKQVSTALRAGIWKDAIAGNQQASGRVAELYDIAKKNGDAQ